ncbi:hypothetical protein DERF_009887 [Dermatophagoides farinae]|uniref:Uncharacterized protein n=1 Tax=Dermatophagoides farinae TaxID=6954 RepID=A0A922HW07_DERFA|nr:hypothetical protein DERF_009887 [Dermatophagoides farinae]
MDYVPHVNIRILDVNSTLSSLISNTYLGFTPDHLTSIATLKIYQELPHAVTVSLILNSSVPVLPCGLLSPFRSPQHHHLPDARIRGWCSGGGGGGSGVDSICGGRSVVGWFISIIVRSFIIIVD